MTEHPVMISEGGRPVLGVLGGMGPAATNDFLARIARLTDAERDQDHVPTLVYSDPGTPDRSDAMLEIGPSPLPAMRRGVEFLNRAGCAVIAIPCNSAHYWYDELVAVSSAPIVHIVDAGAATLAEIDTAPEIVGIMATDGTCKSAIYTRRLAAFGIDAIDLTTSDGPSRVMDGIRAYKAGDEQAARELLIDGGKQLIHRGAQALVFACTDISAALADVTQVDGVPVVDASECLARAGLRELAGAGSKVAAAVSLAGE